MLNPTFLDLQASLPIADFLRLQSFLMDPETKVYQRDVVEVVRKTPGYGLIRYTPVDGGKYPDSGEIKTAWLEDQIALKVCQLAKAFKGKRCVFYQRNVDKSEEQSNGYRELCWIQVVEVPK